MERRVYFRCVIIVVMALHQQRPKGASIYKLQRMFAIGHKTICRWIVYFREVFPSSTTWRFLRGRVDPKLEEEKLPGSLLSVFLQHSVNAQQCLIACLKFFATQAFHGL
jgi:hypothetical protein